MKEKEFVLPSDSSVSDEDYYNFIIKMFNESKEMEKFKIILNFKNVKSFDPTLCASLAVILDYLTKQKKHKFVFRNMPKMLVSIFKNNGFLSKVNINININIKEIENSIRFSKIDAKKENFCKAYLINELKFISPNASVNEATRELIRALLEIFKNIPKHGGHKSKNIGYICGHFFPEDKIMIITIANWGFTFKSNYYKKNKKFENDSEAIIFSLGKGATSRNKNIEPGGLGFALIRNFLKNANGSLAIISGNGLVTERIDQNFRNEKLLENGYPGSVISLVFPVDSPFFSENNIIKNIKEEKISF